MSPLHVADPSRVPFRVSIDHDLPARIIEVDLTRPLPDVSPVDPSTGRRFASVLVLVRLHAQPLGYLKLRARDGEIAPAEYATSIWNTFQPRIVAHLERDGLPAPSKLDPRGLGVDGLPDCLAARQAALQSIPPASVVVATRDRPDRLAECLAALARQDHPSFEVIVVDNAPATNATADLLESGVTGLADLRYAREDCPGTSRARNRGLHLANGEFVAFLDDDAVPDPSWLAETARGFSVGSNVACVNGLILPRELETPAQVWFEEFSGFSRGFTQRLVDLDHHRPADRLFPFTTGRLGSGTTMAFRRSTLLEFGGFDVALGGGTPALGGEDLAAYFEVLVRGYQVVYQPTAMVYHTHRREYPALQHQIFSYGQGLTAYLTRCVIEHPRCLVTLAERLPLAAWYAFSPNSAKNERKMSYPAELNLVELKGMALGPAAYLRGRLRRAPRTPGAVRRPPSAVSGLRP